MEKTIYVFAVIAYFAIMGMFNHIYQKKIANGSLLAADRKLNSMVTSLSLQITDIGMWAMAIIPTIAVGTVAGAKAAFFISLGLIVGYYLSCSLISDRLHVYAKVSHVKSIPAFLSHRYGDKRGIIRILSSVIYVLLSLSFTAFVLSFGASVLKLVFGITYTTAILVSIVIMFAFIAVGGFISSPYSHTIQCLLVLGTLIVVCISLFSSMTLPQKAVFNMTYPDLFSLFPHLYTDENNISVFVMVMCLGWVGFFIGSPQLLTKFLRMKDERVSVRSKVVSTFWTFITLACAIFIGYMCFVTASNVPSHTILIKASLFSGPLIVRCILIITVLGTIATVAKTQVLLASNSFTYDIYPKIRKEADERELKYVNLFTVMIFIAFAGAFASEGRSDSFNILAFSIAGLCSSFGPSVLFSLYTKKVTALGSVMSMVSGIATSFIMSFLLTSKIGYGFGFNIYTMLPSFLIATAVLFGVSALDRNKVSPSVVKEFNRVQDIIKCKGRYTYGEE